MNAQVSLGSQFQYLPQEALAQTAPSEINRNFHDQNRRDDDVVILIQKGYFRPSKAIAGRIYRV